MPKPAKLPKNRLYRGDCLEVMQQLHGEGIAPDLIYLDPPFNSNRNYNIIFGGGKGAQQAAFSDMWEKHYREETEREIADIAGDLGMDGRLVKLLNSWADILGGGNADERGLFNYLLYMARRLVWCHKLLAETGSMYLHCDPTASHYLKVMLDLIFGKKNFRNEIVWAYNRFSRRGDAFPSMNDTIFLYGKSKKARFNPLTVDAKNTERYEKGYHTVVDGGERKLLVYDEIKAAAKIRKAAEENTKIAYTEAREPVMGNVWMDIPILNPMAKERTGFPTQKPLALLERIVNASSNEGDLVFDPFCGCGTTINAAHNLKRKWIGADISLDAVKHMTARAHVRMLLKEGKHYELIECGAQTREEYERLNPYEKQEWLVRQVGGVCGPKGGDGGVDGMLRYHKGGDSWEFGEFIISVKTGKQANPAMLEQLMGVMQKRGEKMGGLILDREPT
ncbi:MAG: site-specific DNA-methyltransferase, partial [Betaproteobacteria bacterium]|nr:site-specific DNA-methyltransferase [Betaproteobacteria bacterium]